MERNPWSHPTWVCGLKPSIIAWNIHYWSHTLRGCVDWNPSLSLYLLVSIVTPYVGVWIETFFCCTIRVRVMSHPTWVCGLKLESVNWWVGFQMSHPTWVCGLKLFYLFLLLLNLVTPYVGVWIETSYSFRDSSPFESHPTWVCGLKRLPIFS